MRLSVRTYLHSDNAYGKTYVLHNFKKIITEFTPIYTDTKLHDVFGKSLKN